MADFHFIRPFWLLALIALIFTLYLLKKHRINQSGWQKLLPQHLAKVLVDSSQKSQSLSLTLPFIIGLLAIVALAGPTWKKLPQPVYQLARGSVLIMDMSYSMYATDVSPNRLTRARYKAIDLLDQLNEGEIGLIAYAGDAFTISPLTEDINNIKLLLPSLSPDLMPELGSNPLSALSLANNMLKNAGHIEGDIYWFTDGIDTSDMSDITQWSRKHSYRLNIMGIGTLEGAPIKLTNGELMKDDSGSIVIPKLSEKQLKVLASAGKGYYSRLTNSSDDVEYLMSKPINKDENNKSESAQTGDQWQEFGPYLLLIALPLVLGYFRRGHLLALLPFFILLAPSKPVHADYWSDLWKTKDQQGQVHFNKNEFKEAADKFKDPRWQGSAHYQAGNYEAALDSFKQGNDAESFYNQGNALAKLQQLDEAIAAYEKALKFDPTHQDAQANKALIEQLKNQQDQQKQEQKDQEQQNQDKQDNEQQSDQSENKQGDQSEDKQQDQQNSQQQNPQKSDKESESKDKNQQDSAQKPEQDKQKEQEAQKAEEEATQDKTNEAQQQQTQALKSQQEKETEQKHQQLLNKVTDDPYLLLRNKMQLEYQKRRQNRSNVGVKKKW